MTTLNKLKNDPNNRNIRDVVMCSGETIKIFEPTAEQVEEIIDMQEEWINGDDLEISGYDIFNKLFPMLTDIKGIEDMTNEEIDDVINNPSVALIQVQNHVETIVTEVYKTVILHARRKLLETDLSLESYKINEENFNRTMSLISKEKGSSLVNKIEKATDNIIEANKKENSEENRIAKLEDYRDEASAKMNKYKNMMEEYQNNFKNSPKLDVKDLGTEE